MLRTAIRTMTVQTAHETTTRRPVEIGVGNSQTQIMMEREAIELNMTLRAKERRRLEEGDTMIGVRVHADWN